MNDTQKEILETIPVEYRDRAWSEANINWSHRGGAFSGQLYPVASYINKCLDSGNEPKFPAIEANKRFIADRKSFYGN